MEESFTEARGVRRQSSSVLRNRGTCTRTERAHAQGRPVPPVMPSNSHSQPCFNGTSSNLSSKRRCSPRSNAGSVYPVLSVLLLSVCTRFYKLTEPPHVWWEGLKKKKYSLTVSTHAKLITSEIICWSFAAGMRPTLGRWAAIILTAPFSLTFIHLLARYVHVCCIFHLPSWTLTFLFIQQISDCFQGWTVNETYTRSLFQVPVFVENDINTIIKKDKSTSHFQKSIPNLYNHIVFIHHSLSTPLIC